MENVSTVGVQELGRDVVLIVLLALDSGDKFAGQE